MKKNINSRYIAMGLALLLIGAFFALHPKGGNFLSPQNLSYLSIELAITATLALGMFIVLLPGMIDLSVGSGVGMLGGLSAVLITRPSYILFRDAAGWSAPVSIITTLLLAVLIWSVMGAFIIHYKIPAIFITLNLLYLN